jgi:hypothetical protein
MEYLQLLPILLPNIRGLQRTTTLYYEQQKSPKAINYRALRSTANGSESGDGGAKRDRTVDLLHAMQALYQLSYSPITIVQAVMLWIHACAVNQRCLIFNRIFWVFRLCERNIQFLPFRSLFFTNTAQDFNRLT